MAIVFDIGKLEEMLGRVLTEGEGLDIMEYAAAIPNPKPKPGDPNYDSFMTIRHNVFTLYRAAAERVGDEQSVAEFDNILAEYTPNKQD